MSRSLKAELRDNGQKLHERLAGAITEAIAAGVYAHGAQLPTHRQLAQQFSVSIGTVTRAIDTLSERGIVRGEIGRGTFVSAAALAAGPDDIIDLTINAPPPMLSHEVLMQANGIAARQALALAHGGYVDHTGTGRQRAVMAQWLSDSRVAVTEDEIVLTNGAQQGLHLAFAALREQSQTIATEGATFPGAIAATANLGMTMLPVEHDGEGMVPEALDKVLGANGCRIIYTTPVCQNPLGFETGPERRRALAKVAERHGAFIVEDDIYGLYAAKGGLTYKRLAPERTFFVTSLSKSLTPLVRLGLVAPPADWRQAVARRMRAESWGMPPFAVELACALIENGAGEDIGRQLLREARARLEMAQRMLGIAEVPMPEGAPHLWLPMSPIAAERLARRASERNVRITPPGATRVGASAIGGVRLCIMAPPTRGELERGLAILAELMGSEEAVIV
jgi:DNA-binding transcriptional MocR family regulator